jgi:gliding motility-associated-like protein
MGSTWTDIAGATNTTFTSPVLSQNTSYRAVVTSGFCSAVNTTTFNVVVNPIPVISGVTTVGVGNTITLTATTTPANSNVWTSSNMNVATINPNGVVNGLTPGSTTITYTNASGCTATQTITVTVGVTQTPVLNSPVSNTTGAKTLNFNYSLPETPLAGSVSLTFTPTAGGTPIVWTMSNATSAIFSYLVGTNPTSFSNVVSGTALAFTTYNVTLSYQDAFGSPAAQVTNTSIQTLSPPNLSLSQTSFSGAVNVNFTPILVLNTGGAATFSITPTLPNGLVLNTITGVISGTPTVPFANTTFTLTANNPAGTTTLTFTLFIDQDTDRDGIPDSVDTDDDGDTILDINDAFPLDKNEWKDSDRDGRGDNADTDDDNDGILDVCDVDVNGDRIPDNGVDMDGDGIIDSCDTDRDGDGVTNTLDNCPDTPNRDQADRDRDGKGDVCDTTELNVSEGLTPNSDGINDTWVVYNLENHPGSIVRVFNANGKEVFYSNNYQNDWAGNYQGSSEMLPVGSYLYQIDLGGNGSIDVQGWLYITK